jgi:hypothetical protein
MKIYKACQECKLVNCPNECFESHVGSVIALKKVIGSTGVKATIIDEDGRRV